MPGDLCYRVHLPGSRHEPTSYQLDYRVASKSDCAEECRRTEFCRSFSYQYQFRTRQVSHSRSRNCLLSRHRAQDLSREERDYASDSDWDLFEFLGGRECSREPPVVGGAGGGVGTGGGGGGNGIDGEGGNL